MKTPFYQKFLIVLLAFVAGLFFIAFLTWAQLIIYYKKITILYSLIFIVLAILINTILNPSSRYNLWLLLSLTLMIIGKTFFIISFNYLLLNSWLMLILSIGIITIVTYPFYKVAIDRFSSILALLIVTQMYIWYGQYTFIIPNIILFYAFIILQIIVAFFLVNKKISSNIQPIFYALIFSLVSAFILIVNDMF